MTAISVGGQANGAVIKWYAGETDITSLTGVLNVADTSTYTTPYLTSPQTEYWVAAEIGTGSRACKSVRRADTAVVQDPPLLAVTSPKIVCNNTITTYNVASDTLDYQTYVWAPTTYLFTDDQALVPYTGGSATTLYARSSVPSTTNYSITAVNTIRGCEASTTTSMSVQLNSATILGNPTSLCINGSSVLSLSPATPYGVGSISWERSTDSLSGWTATPGAVGVTYTTSLQAGTRYYRVVVADGGGTPCFITPFFALTVISPRVESTTPASICGPQNVTISATATAGSVLTWYETAVSTTALAQGNNFTVNNVNSTRTYYVLASVVGNADCVSARIPVTITYSAPPAFTLDVASLSGCAGQPLPTVNVTSGASSFDQFNWTPSAGITGNITNGWVITASTSQTYYLVASQSTGTVRCTNTAAIPVTINPIPTPVLTANRTTFCSGDTTRLSVTNFGLADGTITNGTGLTTQAGSGLSPFAQGWEGQHTQYLITAADLTASGLFAGAISSLQFNVTSAVSTFAFSSYTMKIAPTTATSGLIDSPRRVS